MSSGGVLVSSSPPAAAALCTALVLAGCSSDSPRPHDAPPTFLDTSADSGAASPPATTTLPSSDASLPSAADASIADAGPPAVSCAGKSGPKGDRTLGLTSGGVARDAILHVPSSYDPTSGAMLVLNFHGFGSNASQQVLLSKMNDASDAEDFIVAYPDGVGAGWDAGECCSDLQLGPVDDLQFVRDLLARLESEYCIDPSRVYATGMSNGGFMSHYVACEMADVFAAVAPVAGVLGIPVDQCKPARPVPVLDFHGTADGVVPYNGGAPSFYPAKSFLSAPVTIDNWRKKNDCFDAPKTAYAQGDATCVRYDGCNAGADVTLCTIDGGGHTWPGGTPVPTLGKTSTDIDATSAMIHFFKTHPMR